MVQGKLTLKLVRAITEPGFYGDGNTLFLRVAPGGSKQWVQRLTVHGRRRSIGLGGVSRTEWRTSRMRSRHREEHA